MLTAKVSVPVIQLEFGRNNNKKQVAVDSFLSSSFFFSLYSDAVD